jgi:GT2 family glycosyltransferase
MGHLIAPEIREAETIAHAAPQVSTVVVTYNSAGCIEACLRSLLRQEHITSEIIVVDNHSTDETVRVVRHCGSGVRLLANQTNVGFGRACNQGADISHGQLLYFLNPDAQFERPDGLARLCQVMEQNPSWGLAGTRVLSPDGANEAAPAMDYPSQRHCRRDFSQLPGKIAWVLGASMLVRREIFAALGGFDPQFFLYSEETDLCLRIRQYGLEIGFVPEVTVRHIGQVSERGNDQYQTRLRSMTGLHLFWAKHYPPEDVLRMVRRDWLRASFRREWYALMARFRGPASRAWLKHREYAAVSEASRRFLQSTPEGLPIASRVPKEEIFQ